MCNDVIINTIIDIPQYSINHLVSTLPWQGTLL